MKSEQRLLLTAEGKKSLKLETAKNYTMCSAIFHADNFSKIDVLTWPADCS